MAAETKITWVHIGDVVGHYVHGEVSKGKPMIKVDKLTPLPDYTIIEETPRHYDHRSPRMKEGEDVNDRQMSFVFLSTVATVNKRLKVAMLNNDNWRANLAIQMLPSVYGEKTIDDEKAEAKLYELLQQPGIKLFRFGPELTLRYTHERAPCSIMDRSVCKGASEAMRGASGGFLRYHSGTGAIKSSPVYLGII